MRSALFTACLSLAAPAAMAEPAIKVINFTAEWCPNCQIVDPRILEALEEFPAEAVEYIELDLTAMRGASDAERRAIVEGLIRRAEGHQAGYLWDWYGGVTGLSAIIAADNGEPISCISRALDVEDISYRLTEARILAEKAPAGQRKPDGPDCPPPMR